MKTDPARCFAALDRGKVGYERAPAKPVEDGCGYEDAGVLTRSRAAYRGGHLLLRCPALASLLLWERHAVEPAAEQHLGQPIAAIRHLGTYACRNIDHARVGMRSQHALANAIDIAAFQTKDGMTITVAKDWSGPGPRAQFLRSVRDGACRFFGVVLSPDFNAAHHDHLHFDTSGWSTCR